MNFFFHNFSKLEVIVEKTDWKTQLSFDGKGYVELDKKLLSHSLNMNWEVKINISTWKPNGLLLWQGHIDEENLAENAVSLVNLDQDNYEALGISNGNVLFVSNGVELINDQIFVNDGQNHEIHLKKKNTTVTLSVDGAPETSQVYENLEDETLMKQLQTMDFFLGGLPESSKNWQNE